MNNHKRCPDAPEGSPGWFVQFFSNDYCHLVRSVNLNNKLLWIVLAAIMAKGVIEALNGAI